MAAVAPNASRGVVIVSGASSGIGYACARDLAARGFTVVAGARRAEGLAALATAGDGVMPVRLDVRDQASVDAAIARAEALAGGRGLAGLVNNAGVSLLGPVEALTPETLLDLLDVNVAGALRLTRAALPALRAARGRVVNIGSIAGLSALPFMGGYAASKHALEALTDALRVEVAPWGIGVAIVDAGAIDTPIAGKAIASIAAIDGASPAVAALYGAGLRAFRQAVVVTAAQALPVSHMTRAVAHALTARRPRTRYVVGREAWGRLLLKRLLPGRWHDLAVRLVVGLPGPPQRERLRRA